MGAKVATFEQCYNAEKRRRLQYKQIKIIEDENDSDDSISFPVFDSCIGSIKQC